MSESFVDVTYRGLSLGRRVKLAQVRPSDWAISRFRSPMPVGSSIAIITDDTVALDATVVEVHEQVAGSKPRPAWSCARSSMATWRALVDHTRHAYRARANREPRAVGMSPHDPRRPRAETDDQSRYRRATDLDDGHDTGVMDAIDPAVVDAAGTTSRDLPKIVATARDNRDGCGGSRRARAR